MWKFQWTCEIETEGVLMRPLELVQGRDMLGKGRCKKKTCNERLANQKTSEIDINVNETKATVVKIKDSLKVARNPKKRSFCSIGPASLSHLAHLMPTAFFALTNRLGIAVCTTCRVRSRWCKRLGKLIWHEVEGHGGRFFGS